MLIRHLGLPLSWKPPWRPKGYDGDQA